MDLGKFLSADQVLDIINETYNYVESGEYGNLTMQQFLRLTREILPSTLNSPENLKKIFAVFTGSKDISFLEEESKTLEKKVSSLPILDPQRISEM